MRAAIVCEKLSASGIDDKGRVVDGDLSFGSVGGEYRIFRSRREDGRSGRTYVWEKTDATLLVRPAGG